MERPTRRASAAHANANANSSSAGAVSPSVDANDKSMEHDGGNGGENGAATGRRRRREADAVPVPVASPSDGAETDSSSVATDVARKSTRRVSGRNVDAKKLEKPPQDKDEADAVDAEGAADAEDDVVVDDEQEQEQELDHDKEEQASAADAKSDGPSTRPRRRKSDAETADSSSPTVDADPASARVSEYETRSTRPRRDRSHSVVSTTSETSSVLSENVEGEDQSVLYEEKLLELEKKRQMVEDGSLTEYCRRVAEFKDERQRLLETAELHKNLQLKNTQDLHGFEVQRAHNIWQEAKDRIKQEMLSKMDALTLQLQRELDVLTKTGAVPKHVERSAAIKLAKRPAAATSTATTTATTPATVTATASPKDTRILSSPTTVVAVETTMVDQPSSEMMSLTGDPRPASPKRRKVGSAPIPDHLVCLPLDVISADLASIVSAREHASSSVLASLSAPRLDLRIDRRRLLCGKYVFEEGDEVVVTSAVLHEDYIGVISSVTNDEVFVKLSTNQKVRVLVEHIALRRCEIRPFLRGSAGIDSFQATGWVECEPF